MTTNKTRRLKRSKKRHSKNKDKDKNILDHVTTKKKHRRHRKRVHSNSSWENHYIYESSDPELSNTTNKNYTNNTNKGNIVNGLRDFLALKKDIK